LACAQVACYLVSAFVFAGIIALILPARCIIAVYFAIIAYYLLPNTLPTYYTLYSSLLYALATAPKHCEDVPFARFNYTYVLWAI